MNFNTYPYYDDYNEDNKFLRVLFRPGFPVQARELTQAQSILQNQVSRIGDNIFKNGSKVTGGDIGFDKEYPYVKLQTYYETYEVSTYVQEFVGQKIIGEDTGVEALVVFALEATETDPATLYVQYTNSGTDTETKTFSNNEKIVSQDEANQRNAYTFSDTTDTSATGLGSSASVKEGVYYINGFFTKVDEQRIILSKYDSTPTARVGLEIVEEIVVPEDDSTLYDNAIGSTNFTAPGAHRFKIQLNLTTRDVEDTSGDTKFIELMRVEDGVLKSLIKNVQYADIMDTMARRTYDESGNYTIKPFGINIREHRSNDRGIWVTNTAYKTGDIVKNSTTGIYYTARNSGISYGINPPEHEPSQIGYVPVKNDNGSVGIWWEYTPSMDTDGFEKRNYNGGVYSPEDGGDESLVAIGIERGKAYVYGYEIEKLDTTYLPIPKARTYANILEGTIPTPVGNYIRITNVSGLPDLSTFPVVDLYSSTSGGSKIGTARIRGIELESGANGSTAAVYKVSLFDVNLTSGCVVKTTVTNPGTGYGAGTYASFADPVTASTWTAGATATVGNYLKYNYSGVTNFWKVVSVDPVALASEAGPELGASPPSQTILNETEINGDYTLEYVATLATGAAIVASNTLVGVSITNPGRGYASKPPIVISGGGGLNAAASCTIGKVDLATNVKRLESAFFAATVYEESTSLQGTISYTTLGNNLTPFKITGNGTQFLNLMQGSHLIASNGARIIVAYIVDNKTLYATSVSPNATFTEQAVSITNTPIYDPNNLSLIYPLSYKFIRTIRDIDDTNISTTQYVRKQYNNYQISGSTFTITTDTSYEAFLTPDSGAYSTDKNYIFYISSGANAGKIITPVSMDLSPNGRVLQVQVDNNYAGQYVTMIATVRQSLYASKERTKSIVYNYVLELTTEAKAKATTISLGKADIYKLVRVTQSVGVEFGGNYYNDPLSPDPEIDITDNYILDDGQRNTHYDIGTITLKAGKSAPSGPIRIVFEYFEHDTNGNYFSVDSYVGFDYKNIPKYKGTSLADVIDYRPRINDDGITFENVPSLPKRTQDMVASYSYYYGRRGTIYLKKDGLIGSLEGTPSDTPELPASLSDCMDLYNMSYAPYTNEVTNSTIIPKFIENRRYTMRDIGEIDDKLKKIIEYTNMSALEKSAAASEITDPILGVNRLKAGFITDSFDGHQLGDINSNEYTISIDTVNQEMRPRYNIESINLVEQNTSASQRAAKGYANNNDILTLRHYDIELIKQIYASRTENINPFAIFTFIGSMTMNPDTDEWVDIQNVDITTVDTKEKDALTSIANASVNPVTGKRGLLGQYYGAWEQVVTGVTRTVAGPKYRISDYSRAHASQNIPGRESGYFRDQHDEVTAMQTQEQRKVYTTEIKLIGNSTPVLTADRVTATNIVPYIRSRPVLFVSKALKPSTTVNAYFDGTVVNDYVTPASKLTYVLTSGTFDDSSPVGSGTRETPRLSLIDKKTSLAYNKGDIVYVQTRSVTDETTGLTTTNTYTIANSPATAVVALVETFVTSGKRVLHLVNVKGSFLFNDVIVGSISSATGVADSIETPSKLVTNVSGQVAGVFNIPNNPQLNFRTGSRIFRISDSATNTGSSTRAEKTYFASGIKEVHQRSFSSISHYEIATRELGTEVGNTTWVNIPGTQRTVIDSKSNGFATGGWYDPLAQTFLVQNPGGAMITKLDVYFQSKDEQLPVRLEIRETDNGYPSKTIIPFSQVTMESDDVKVSDDASVATTFHFPTPISLRDKTEYAIVLLSDSNNYKVWVSQMGETDVKTGRLIGEQPYMGVLFKSQNGSTWTAEQMQDLKFTLYRAKYETGLVATVDLINDINPYQLLDPNPFETTLDSDEVIVTQYNHGLTVNSYVSFTMDETITINGIPATDFTNNPLIAGGLHQATEIIDQHKYKIKVARTGNSVGVEDQVDTPVPNLAGYAGGVNVYATQNINFNELHPQLDDFLMPDTYIEYSIKVVSGRSLDGTEIPYVFKDSYVDLVPNSNNKFDYPHMIASALNQEKMMQNNNSLMLRAKMYTTNDACTPMINLSRCSAIVVENMINNQVPTETDESLCRYLTKKIKLATSATGIYADFSANIPTEANVSLYYKVSNSSDGDLFDKLAWNVLEPMHEVGKSDDRYTFNTYSYKIDTVPGFDGGFNTLQVKLVMTSTNSSAVPRIKDLKVIALV